jgi:hypothetical protein
LKGKGAWLECAFSLGNGLKGKGAWLDDTYRRHGVVFCGFVFVFRLGRKLSFLSNAGVKDFGILSRVPSLK